MEQDLALPGNSSKPVRGNPNKIKPFQFKPGQSGNPGGRPKRDLAAEIAQAIFEENADLIYRALRRALLTGDPKVFVALANRAYGRVAEPMKPESGGILLLHNISRPQR